MQRSAPTGDHRDKGQFPLVAYCSSCETSWTRSEVTEEEIYHWRGQIEGILLGIRIHTDQDTSFDRDQWEDHFGARVVWESFPAYPSEEAARRQEDASVLMDWDDETETLYLKQDVALPDDREGSIVFADGLAVTDRVGKPRMFKFDETETGIIEAFSDVSLEIIREAYGYDGS